MPSMSRPPPSSPWSRCADDCWQSAATPVADHWLAQPVLNLLGKRSVETLLLGWQVVPVSTVHSRLLSTTHYGFPVVTPDGKFVGMILRSQLVVLLRNAEGKCWVVRPSQRFRTAQLR